MIGIRVVVAVVPAVVAAVVVTSAVAAPDAQASSVWPRTGQAAYVLGSGRTHHAHQHIAPIASMSKVMTGYLVLRAHPLRRGANGFRMTVTGRDVADSRKRVGRGESTVPVRAGEQLTERQALAALLLPSANNIAIMLARAVSGTVHRFVASMNRTARGLGMEHTTYTDPSGFDSRTRSTAADQVIMARAAMTRGTLRALVALKAYRIPVAGTIHTTDALLGSDGFVGIKTGSMDASGGCFMFLSHRRVHGRRVDLYGVVMGQTGGDYVAAALAAAKRFADRIAPHAG